MENSNGWKIFGIVMLILVVIFLLIIAFGGRTDTEDKITDEVIDDDEVIDLCEGIDCGTYTVILDEGTEEETESLVEIYCNPANGKCLNCNEEDELIANDCLAIKGSEDWECNEETHQCEEIDFDVGNVTEESIVTSNIEEYHYNDFIDWIFTDRELEGLLQDKKISFNGDDSIDIHEELEFVDNKSGFFTSLIDSEFDTDVYMVLTRGSVNHYYVVDDDILLSNIDDETPLEIEFLGEDYEIISATGSCFTYYRGDKKVMKVGDSITVDDKKVELVNVGETESIIVAVGGVAEIIGSGRTKEINGVEITNLVVFYEDTKGERVAEIRIGEKVRETVCSGDEFLDSEEFRWIVDDKSNGTCFGRIGWELDVDYEDLDEEYIPFAVGEYFTSPNDFLEFGIESITSEDYIRYDGKMENGYLEIRGDDSESFVSGAEDWNTILVNDVGIYDRDLNLIGTSVNLGESIYSITAGTIITFDNVEITIDYLAGTDGQFTNMSIGGKQITSKADPIMNSNGLQIDDPEENYESNKFRISVPDERPEIEFIIRG